MDLKMPCAQAHPASGKGVVSMDDVDVDDDVARVSVRPTSNPEERMSKDE